MLSASNLWKAFGGQDLFKGANFRVNSGDRVAVIGANGSGKTTLFDILAGEESPDRGEISKLSGLAVGYLRQETDALRGNSVLEEVVSGRPELAGDSHRLHELEHRIAQADEHEHPRLLARYGQLRAKFESLGGYDVEHEAKKILGGLAFRPGDFSRQTESFSGGWMMRIALAKLLVARPDLLLLDEPTNHLDLASVEWLEKFLASYGGTVVFTSHDREFINGFARKIIEVRDHGLFEYSGNFDDFVEQRELAERQKEQALKQQARKIEASTRFIERFRYKKTKARQVQSRIKMLDRMEKVEAPRPTRRAMHLRFPTPPRLGRVAMELSNIEFAYEQTPVFDDLNLVIEGSWKVALVGPNGAGKTTLLKLLAGVLQPRQGELTLGHNVDVGYFAQHQIEALNPNLTVLEELEELLPPAGPIRARNLLGRFLFSGDDVYKKTSVLSGGERTRLAMAKLLSSPHSLLCLDEPTNHLDMQSRDVVGEALTEFQGCLVLITHDRNLIREVANRIVRVVAGKITVYGGDYDYYLEQQERESTGGTSKESPGQARVRTERRRTRDAEPRALERRLKARLSEIERQLDQATGEMDQLAAVLADPKTYAGGGNGNFSDLVRDYEFASEKVRELEAQWDQLAERLGKMS